MANKSKINESNVHVIRSFCEKGYNPTYIGKQMGLAKDTVNSWAKKNGYVLNNRKSKKTVDVEPLVVELLEKGKTRKEIQKHFKISYDAVTEIAKKHGLESKLKNRQKAAQEKMFTMEEATSKLPPGSGQVIGYNHKKRKYVIQALDGFVYYKSSARIGQGDPRNKSGTRLTLDNVRTQLSRLGYEYVEGWTIKRNPIKATHLECGQIRENVLANFYSQSCAVCSNKGISRSELELMEWVKLYYPSAHKYKFEERITKPKEIDIYIPELKIGIEYCGLYWHSEKINDAQENKHYLKMLRAKKEGIRLITIFENEWINRKNQVKGFLMSVFQKNEHRIYARNCEVLELTKEQADSFLDETHIQGPSPFKVCFGLVYNEQILGIITGGHHPQRPQKDGKLYLNRLAFKANTSIPGGASRLLKSLINYAKQNGYTEIVSWSDNRWSEGNVYTSLGFKFSSQKDKGRGLEDGSVWPDFHYVMAGKLYSRGSASKLGIDLRDVPKIYDCGKKRWAMKIS